MGWTEITECPFCGGKDTIKAGRGMRPIVQNPAVMDGVPMAVLTFYYQCASCGLTRQSPRLTDAEIAEFYTSGVYRQFINDTQEEQDSYERRRYQRVAEMLPKRSSLLDVGCSRGYLLDMALNHGYQSVLGVEPNLDYVTSVQPVTSTLDGVSGLWDVVVCLHTLEHVADPFAMAHRLQELLAPDGWLFIETPCNPSSSQDPYGLSHLYHFPPWIIRKMFPYPLIYFLQVPHFLHVFRKGEYGTAA